jgi:hypothetical protein
MYTNVPQFIDIEDKIAFGLTWKQLLWLMGMGAVLMTLYTLLDRPTFFVTGIPVVLIFVALAFVKPYGVSFLTFLGFAFRFLTRSKNYVWKRSYSGSGVDLRKAALAQREKFDPQAQVKKAPTADQLKKIAWTLDTKK